MHLSWLPPFTFLAGFVAVSLAASGQPLGEWTVSNASRKRSQINTLCTWHFTVTDNTSGGHTNNVFDCDFNVTAQPGADCGLTSFQDYCSGNEAFTVNGGHSELGFVVVVLADTVQKSQAFFGFGDDALDSGSEIVQQTKPVYAQTTVKRDDISVPRDGGSAVVANATEWIVEDLFRDVNVPENLITVGFRVNDGSPSGARCVLRLTPPAGTDMETWEWYNRKCEGSGYFASWGYLATGDAGIMTIVNSTRNGQAFFGFSDINSNRYLGDAGPNPVSSCSCG